MVVSALVLKYIRNWWLWCRSLRKHVAVACYTSDSKAIGDSRSVDPEAESDDTDQCSVYV